MRERWPQFPDGAVMVARGPAGKSVVTVRRRVIRLGRWVVAAGPGCAGECAVRITGPGTVELIGAGPLRVVPPTWGWRLLTALRLIRP